MRYTNQTSHLASTGNRRHRSIGVLVDLELAENAGGHVKCWQRIAEAATGFADVLDLTVYFLGDREVTIPLGDTVRYVTLPPRMGTRRIGFLSQGAGHTDLAPHHSLLARQLRHHDVLHTTNVFAFGQTARKVARERAIPLLTSIHTDLPLFTEIYTAEILHRTLGDGPVTDFILDDLDAGRRSARAMRRKVDDMVHRSDHVIVSNEMDRRRAARIVGEKQVSTLRRGIDKDRFHPGNHNRPRLFREFGIPGDCPVLLFVGRIDATKNAMLAAGFARSLIDNGHDLRFLAIGDGAQRSAVANLLGPNAVLPGQIAQEDLGWIYPSADIFVFPSESEATGNVVLEARAAGLPVLVADHPGTSQLVRRPGKDGFILHSADPAAWHRVLEALISRPDFRRHVGNAAHRAISEYWPRWHDVVAQDLLPFWCDTIRRSAKPLVLPAMPECNDAAATSRRAA